jgi:aryl-alcohol dehydrogenase-like predicted oxidoreductase
MQKRTLGKTHLDVSVLGYGCAPSAFLKAGPEPLAQLINALLDAGINLIDTATMYPGSEQFIGNHLSHRRKDYVLVSKVGGTKGAEIVGEPWTDQLITTSIDRALKLMKTDYVDVMLLHSCDLKTLEADEALESLVKAREAGKIRFAGYSGDNEAATFAAKLPDVAVVETSINYVDQVNITGLLPVAKANNVGIIAKRPVANAAWIGLANMKGLYVNYAKDYTQRHDAMGLKAEDLGMNDSQWAELALRFTLSFPQITTAIVGTTKQANAMANIEYASKGPLSAEQIKLITDRFKQTPGSDSWIGLT